MNLTDLEQKLDKSLSDFSSEIAALYNDYDKTPAAYADISFLAHQTLYLVSDFKKEIIKYLSDK